MSHNFFASTFGTTAMGHLSLIAGPTHGATASTGAVLNITSGKMLIINNGSVITNIDLVDDDCSTTVSTRMSGKNIGDLLNATGKDGVR